jgi:hypothetical protein
MFAIIGIACVILGVLATLSAAVVVALRVLRVRQRIAALPSHPLFETEWVERQTLTVHNLAANLQALNEGLETLVASIGRIVIALEALDGVRRLTAQATEDMLDRAVPWLRHLFAKK